MKYKLAAILCSSMLMLSSCQSQQNIEISSKTTPTVTVSIPNSSTQISPYPNRVQDTFSSKNGEIITHVDAQIITDIPDHFPVYSIVPKELTDRDAARYIKALIGNRTLYATKEGSFLPTKSWIKTVTDAYYAKKASEPDPQAQDMWQYQIDYLLGQYDDAPESRYETPALLQFSHLRSKQSLADLEYEWNTFGRIYSEPATQEEYDSIHGDFLEAYQNPSEDTTQLIEGITDLGGGDEAYICIYKNAYGKHQSGLEYSRYNRDIATLDHITGQKEFFPEVSISYDRALDIAQDTIIALGGNYLVSTETDRETEDTTAHYFTFVRSVDTLPVTIVEWPEGGLGGLQDRWNQERLDIVIDDKGIRSLHWINPTELTETQDTMQELLPWECILNIFKEEIALSGKHEEGATPEFFYISAIDYHIDRIQLGTMMIPAENQENQFTLVPVWDFFGSYTVTYHEDILEYKNKHESGFPLDENLQRTVDSSNFSFLTINARDGSIINRQRGY